MKRMDYENVVDNLKNIESPVGQHIQKAVERWNVRDGRRK